MIHQQWGDTQVAHIQRYTGAKRVGLFQSGKNRSAGLRVPLGQAAVQRQGHRPGGLPQKERHFRRELPDLPHVVAVRVGQEHAMARLARSGDSGKSQIFDQSLPC